VGIVEKPVDRSALCRTVAVGGSWGLLPLGVPVRAGLRLVL